MRNERGFCACMNCGQYSEKVTFVSETFLGGSNAEYMLPICYDCHDLVERMNEDEPSTSVQ